ncbi:putative serine protease eda2 [Quercus suber]|uniref:Serine protease eda2 n=1 Tax=Quercus suber TaxID=58331 RepID=A0AAW0J0P0_QUESU
MALFLLPLSVVLIALFLLFWQESLNSKSNRAKVENPWFVFGVSYPGALSAWFRLKFPHLTCGSLASSAVVLAVYNYTEFDKQLEIDGDFFYFLADAAAIAFQYGNPDKLCSPLVEAKKAGDNLVDAYAKYVKEYYLGSFGVNVQTYNQKHLKNTALSEDSADRLWWFQVCTEVAYFQVAPLNDSVRSTKVDTRHVSHHLIVYHLDLCKNVFGEGIYPDVAATNIYYGGTKIAGSKIVFTNGSQDPWRHASKQTSSTDMPSYTISCHNCGHGTDLRGCPQAPLNIEGNAENCSSPDAVNKVRQQIVEHIDLWLSQCQDAARSAI